MSTIYIYSIVHESDTKIVEELFPYLNPSQPACIADINTAHGKLSNQSHKFGFPSHDSLHAMCQIGSGCTGVWFVNVFLSDKISELLTRIRIMSHTIILLTLNCQGWNS